MATQMAVRQAWKAALKKSKTTLPPSQINVSSPVSSVSPITGSSDSPSKNTRSKTPTTHASTPTTRGSRESLRLKPKTKLTRMNPRAMQKHRVNKLAMSEFSKSALKRATLWYASESKKRWFIFVRDSGEGEEGVRWRGSACCYNSKICKCKSSWHVAIEVWGERGRAKMGFPVCMPRIRELRSHPAAQLPPGRDHLQEACSKVEPSLQEGQQRTWMHQRCTLLKIAVFVGRRTQTL